jgi:hypothetical protein
MGRWVIVARQSSFFDEKRGCVSIAWDKTRNLFLMFT